MTTNSTITLPLDLSKFEASPEAQSGSVTTDSNGITLKAASGSGDDLFWSNFYSDRTFTEIAALAGSNGYHGTSSSIPMSATELHHVYLAAGTQLSINYTWTTSDPGAENDYAFAALQYQGVSDSNNAFSLADQTSLSQAGITNGSSVGAISFKIVTSGYYDLLLGDVYNGSSSGSTLHIGSVTESFSTGGPDGVTLSTAGLLAADGTLIGYDGVVKPVTGPTIASDVSAGGQALLRLATGTAGSSLISQDGGTLISQDGGTLISQDGGTLISQDGGTIVAQGGGNIVAQGGGNIVAQGGGNFTPQARSFSAASPSSSSIQSLIYAGKDAQGNDTYVSTGPKATKASYTPPAQTLTAPHQLGYSTSIGNGPAAGVTQGDASVAALENGKFVVAWDDDAGSPGRFEIRAQIFNADGTAAAASFVVSTDKTHGSQEKPSVVGVQGGGFAVSWLGVTDSAHSQADVHLQMFDAQGAKVQTEARVGLTGVTELGARLGSTWDGGFVLTYQQQTSGGDSAGVAVRYDKNRVVTSITPVGDHDGAGAAAGVQVSDLASAGLDSGDEVVVYREQSPNGPSGTVDGDHDGIFLDRINADGSTPFSRVQVNTTSTGSQYTPSVARLSNNNIVVAWVDSGTSFTTGQAIVRAQVIDSATGAKIGSELSLGTTLAGQDIGPSVVALDQGGFAVTWTGVSLDNGQVASSHIESQIFTNDATQESAVYDVGPASKTSTVYDKAPATIQVASGSDHTIFVLGQHTSQDGTSSIRASAYTADDRYVASIPTVDIAPISGDGVLSASEQAAAASHGLVVSGTTKGVDVGQAVAIGLDGQSYSASVQADGSWSLTLSGAVAGRLAQGYHQVTARAADPSGRVSIANATLRVGTPTFLYANVDGVHGQALWATDGSGPGHLVADINPGTADAQIGMFTTIGAKAVFVANDGVHGSELWTSDGTATGTRLVKDIHTDANDTASYNGGANITVLGSDGSRMFFVARDGDPADGAAYHGTQLWASDGTAAGTQMLTSVSGSSTQPYFSIDLSAGHSAIVGGKLYFGANDGIHGEELWVSDGTVAGTHLLKDIAPGSDGNGQPNSGVSIFNGGLQLAGIGNEVYFQANDGVHGLELWKSDGTAAGTTMVEDIDATQVQSGDPSKGTLSSSPNAFVVDGNTLLFNAGLNSGAYAGEHLWASTGSTYPGTYMVGVQPVARGAVVDGVYYFAANVTGSNSVGTELYATDQFGGATHLVRDIDASGDGHGNPYSSSPSSITALGHKILFVADADATGSSSGDRELWVSDGTSAGTHMVKEINTTSNNGGSAFTSTVSDPPFVTYNGVAVFAAYDGTSTDLWRSDGTAAGTFKLANGTGVNVGAAFSQSVVVDSSGLFFEAYKTGVGTELYKTDGITITDLGATAPTVGSRAVTPVFAGAATLAAPSLAAASDTGASSSDGITRDTTPTVTGTVAAGLKVTLYDGTKTVGSATADKVTGAYTITSSTLAAGGHQLTVKTTDATGKLSDPSSALALTIDTSAPKAPVLSVATLTKNSSVTISGTGEVGAVITLTDGKTTLGTVDVLSDGTFGTTATLTDGSHALTAKATDLAGNVGASSSAKTVVVDTRAPTVPAAPTLASTSDTGRSTGDAITRDATPTLTGKTEAGATVRLYDTDGTTLLGTTVASTSGAYTVTSSSLPDGTHTLTVTATDKAGNVSARSAGKVVTIDTTAPATPAAPTLDVSSATGFTGTATADSTPKIIGTADAGTTVTLYDNARTKLGSATAGSDGGYAINSIKLADGVHNLTVTSTDAAGNVAPASPVLKLTIDTKAPAKPSLTLDAASDTGASKTDGITSLSAPTLTGKATAGSAVAIYEGAAPIGFTQVGTNGTYSLTLGSLTDGVHKLTAKAVDLAGNKSASAAKTVTIDTTPPSVAITSPVADGAGKRTVSGTGEVGSTVTLTDAGAKVGTAVIVGSTGKWSEVITFKTTGAHDLVASAIDKAGNTASSLNAMVQAMSMMSPQSSTTMSPSASSPQDSHPLAAAH